MAISKISAATNINDVLVKNFLAKLPGGGRRTRYALAITLQQTLPK